MDETEKRDNLLKVETMYSFLLGKLHQQHYFSHMYLSEVHYKAAEKGLGLLRNTLEQLQKELKR